MQPQQPADRRKNKSSDESTAATSSSHVTSPRSPASTAHTSVSSPRSPQSPGNIDLPRADGSPGTLLYLGLSTGRAQQIWRHWSQVGPDNYDGDFGDHARGLLRNLVASEGCDIDEPDVDWSARLREIGANEDLVKAISQRGSEYDGVRLRHSAAEWVDLTIEARWEHLLSDAKVEIPPTSPVQVYTVPDVADQLSQMQVDDVTGFSYDPKTHRVTDIHGERPSCMPFWKGCTRVRAEQMWSGEYRTGDFNLKGLLSSAPSDFCGRTKVYYFTPELEAAQRYAGFAKVPFHPAGVCLVRVEVPTKLWTETPRLELRSPSLEWQQVVFCSRKSDPVAPKDLQRSYLKAQLLVGDTTTGTNQKYGKMGGPANVNDKCLLKLKSVNRPVTQFVFGHSTSDDFEQAINKLPHKITIRHHGHPNRKLDGLPKSSMESVD
ncbi:hypothetical protein LTR53_009369 [Teratosphaeriaceae sp. CCFEE 6253]|nr:hypothetical protein LTR53_009369 [Teratosphaeriaceae sp. CCFEE 6253]